MKPSSKQEAIEKKAMLSRKNTFIKNMPKFTSCKTAYKKGFKDALDWTKENQNQWIKIESEKDLPTDDKVFYFACNNEYIYKSIYSKADLIDDYSSSNPIFTHYQPIIKPNRPIY